MYRHILIVTKNRALQQHLADQLGPAGFWVNFWKFETAGFFPNRIQGPVICIFGPDLRSTEVKATKATLNSQAMQTVYFQLNPLEQHSVVTSPPEHEIENALNLPLDIPAFRAMIGRQMAKQKTAMRLPDQVHPDTIEIFLIAACPKTALRWKSTLSQDKQFHLKVILPDIAETLQFSANSIVFIENSTAGLRVLRYLNSAPPTHKANIFMICQDLNPRTTDHLIENGAAEILRDGFNCQTAVGAVARAVRNRPIQDRMRVSNETGVRTNFIDAKTGLYNCAYALSFLNGLEQSGQETTAFLLSISPIEDGQSAAWAGIWDRGVRKVASRLKALLIEGEVLARSNDTQFLIILPTPSERRSNTLAKSATLVVQDYFQRENHTKCDPRVEVHFLLKTAPVAAQTMQAIGGVKTEFTTIPNPSDQRRTRQDHDEVQSFSQSVLVDVTAA